ncbi:MAG: hypothetical protein Q9200_002523 [Gallowayella weberi]
MSRRLTANQYLPDIDQWVDEPPETPAPVFAVRAIKTAIWGTPHPNQHESINTEDKPSPDKAGRSKQSPRAKFSTPKIVHKSHIARKATPLMSPAKGILLTPGTATTRRKNVTFGGLEQNFHPAAAGTETILPVGSSKENEEKKTLQSTKESFEAQLNASKQRLSEQDTSKQQPHGHDTSALVTTDRNLAFDGVLQNGGLPVQSELIDITDHTVDLTKPRSQSGQHWKAEFERYQKNSDLELKKIIQHGQSVKSYAEKKDLEATQLQEKLKRELAKCTAMEAKVTNLATQLTSGKKHGKDGSVEQETLLDDLSRQTALAIKYKQKAERYRVAIQRQKILSLGHSYDGEPYSREDLTVNLPSANNAAASDLASGKSELSALRAELDAFRVKLSIAEERAATLEARNAKLTMNFLRVKNEMSNYDGRRVRKEAALKERTERLVAEKDATEAKLKQLTKDHEDLLRRFTEPPVPSAGRQPMFSPNRQSVSYNRKSTLLAEGERPPLDAFVDRHTDRQAGKASNTDPKDHVRKRPNTSGPPAPTVDIWTMETPSDTGNTTPAAAEPAINLSSIAVREITHDALREIDRNSIPDYPSEAPLPPDTPRPTLQHLATMDSYLQPDFPSSNPTSAAKRMHDRRSTIPSPRPSMVNMASSPGKARGSLVSAAGSLRSITGPLPPDRAAAAKARLAEKKSLKERSAR